LHWGKPPGVILLGQMLGWYVVVLLIFTAITASAQPRNVEIWGNVGAARVGGDEGWNGAGIIYGGGVAVPVTRRLAVEADVARVKVDRFGTSTHTLISPALVWRWGSERMYGFAGGGLGMEGTRSTGVLTIRDENHNPTFQTIESTNFNAALQGRGGIVFSPNNHLIVRVEAFTSFQYALPTAGVKAGIGYRF
jgi:hypothetical protein